MNIKVAPPQNKASIYSSIPKGNLHRRRCYIREVCAKRLTQKSVIACAAARSTHHNFLPCANHEEVPLLNPVCGKHCNVFFFISKSRNESFFGHSTPLHTGVVVEMLKGTRRKGCTLRDVCRSHVCAQKFAGCPLVFAACPGANAINFVKNLQLLHKKYYKVPLRLVDSDASFYYGTQLF